MKITAIEAIPLAIPYAKLLRFADREVRTAEHVRVHTDGGGGLTGVAEAPPRPSHGENQKSISAVLGKNFGTSLGLRVTTRLGGFGGRVPTHRRRVTRLAAGTSDSPSETRGIARGKPSRSAAEHPDAVPATV